MMGQHCKPGTAAAPDANEFQPSLLGLSLTRVLAAGNNQLDHWVRNGICSNSTTFSYPLLLL